MTKEEALRAIQQCDIRAHMKAAICITSPACELEQAISEASAELEKCLIEHLEKYLTSAPAAKD